MRTINASIPELLFVAATRGLGGIGIGLLVSKFFYPEERRRIGLTLLAVGAVTTLPIAARILTESRRVPLLADPRDQR
jgi:hypothetical protein